MGQLDVLAAFRAFVAREKRSPKLRELQAEMGGSPSVPAIHESLKRLVRRGVVVKEGAGEMLNYRLPEQKHPLSGTR